VQVHMNFIQFERVCVCFHVLHAVGWNKYVYVFIHIYVLNEWVGRDGGVRIYMCIYMCVCVGDVYEMQGGGEVCVCMHTYLCT
jgi:hypothetical protein